MLKDSLYIIKKISEENNAVEAIIELNKQHEIFKGHFPGQPVLPGACMLQMMKEILQSFFNKNLQLIKAGEIKFLVMIDPTVSAELKFSIQYNFNEAQQLHINAKILKMDDLVCCKMKMIFHTSLRVINFCFAKKFFEDDIK